MLLGRALAVLGVAYVAVLVGWLVSQPLPALQDFGEWVFQGWAMLGLLRGDAAMHAQFAATWFPVPNLLSQWLLVAATALVGPFAAAKVLVAVYCVGATGVCARAARRFRPGAWGATFAVLLALAAFNSCFWHGYANYQVGVVLFVLFLERAWGRRVSAWAYCGWGLLFYACHGSVLIAFALLVVAREWRRWRVMLSLVPAVGLFVAYLARRRSAGAHAGTAFSLVSHVAYKGYTLVKAGPYQNLVDARGVSAVVQPVAYHAGVVLNVSFGLVLAGVLVWGLWRVAAGGAAVFADVLGGAAGAGGGAAGGYGRGGEPGRAVFVPAAGHDGVAAAGGAMDAGHGRHVPGGVCADSGAVAAMFPARAGCGGGFPPAAGGGRTGVPRRWAVLAPAVPER